MILCKPKTPLPNIWILYNLKYAELCRGFIKIFANCSSVLTYQHWNSQAYEAFENDDISDVLCLSRALCGLCDFDTSLIILWNITYKIRHSDRVSTPYLIHLVKSLVATLLVKLETLCYIQLLNSWVSHSTSNANYEKLVFIHEDWVLTIQL